MSDHTARFSESKRKVTVSCSCGKNLGRHGSWPDARQAHDKHLYTMSLLDLRDYFKLSRGA